MTTVYMNLHPDYSYSTAILSGSYFDVREYVMLVDWLMWDGMGKSPSRQILISGDVEDLERAKKQHLERAEVFAQRLQQKGVHVLVRNERNEEWKPFISPERTNEELVAIECERWHEADEERWAKRDIEKYSALIEKYKDMDVSDLIAILQEAKERLRRYEDSEAARIEAVKRLWS